MHLPSLSHLKPTHQAHRQARRRQHPSQVDTTMDARHGIRTTSRRLKRMFSRKRLERGECDQASCSSSSSECESSSCSSIASSCTRKTLDPHCIRASTFEWTWNWDSNWTPDGFCADQVAPGFATSLSLRTPTLPISPKTSVDVSYPDSHASSYRPIHRHSLTSYFSDDASDTDHNSPLPSPPHAHLAPLPTSNPTPEPPTRPSIVLPTHLARLTKRNTYTIRRKPAPSWTAPRPVSPHLRS